VKVLKTVFKLQGQIIPHIDKMEGYKHLGSWRSLILAHGSANGKSREKAVELHQVILEKIEKFHHIHMAIKLRIVRELAPGKLSYVNQRVDGGMTALRKREDSLIRTTRKVLEVESKSPVPREIWFIHRNRGGLGLRSLPREVMSAPLKRLFAFLSSGDRRLKSIALDQINCWMRDSLSDRKICESRKADIVLTEGNRRLVLDVGICSESSILINEKKKIARYEGFYTRKGMLKVRHCPLIFGCLGGVGKMVDGQRNFDGS
jgi:hypothetical protein